MSTQPTAPIRDIVVKGARTHNLKQVDVTLPARKLIVITGVSGSGKSSLAFDTIYAEGQRRYVESLSAYARQFLERMERPDVDSIHGISPAIAIRQKNSIRNPRSTVGTTTEIHDYLRLLFARVGRTFCRNCGREVIRESAEVVAQRLAGLPDGTRLLLGFEMPIVSLHVTAADEDAAREDDDEGGTSGRTTKKDARLSLESTLETLRRRGFTRVLLDGQMQNLADVPLTSLEGRATLEVIVDRIKVGARRRRAPHRLARDRVPGGRRRGLRDRAARSCGDGGPRVIRRQSATSSPSASSAARAASRTRCRSRGCSRSTTRSAPARPATASAT